MSGRILSGVSLLRFQVARLSKAKGVVDPESVATPFTSLRSGRASEG
jgi:hypothetical protein